MSSYFFCNYCHPLSSFHNSRTCNCSSLTVQCLHFFIILLITIAFAFSELIDGLKLDQNRAYFKFYTRQIPSIFLTIYIYIYVYYMRFETSVRVYATLVIHTWRFRKGVLKVVPKRSYALVKRLFFLSLSLSIDSQVCRPTPTGSCVYSVCQLHGTRIQVIRVTEDVEVLSADNCHPRA